MKKSLDEKLDDLIVVSTGIFRVMTLFLTLIAIFLFWLFVGVLVIFGANANIPQSLEIEFICAIVIVALFYGYVSFTILKAYSPDERGCEEDEEVVR